MKRIGLASEPLFRLRAIIDRCPECGGTDGKHIEVFQREFSYSDGFGEVAGHFQKCTREGQ